MLCRASRNPPTLKGSFSLAPSPTLWGFFARRPFDLLRLGVPSSSCSTSAFKALNSFSMAVMRAFFACIFLSPFSPASSLSPAFLLSIVELSLSPREATSRGLPLRLISPGSFEVTVQHVDSLLGKMWHLSLGQLLFVPGSPLPCLYHHCASSASYAGTWVIPAQAVEGMPQVTLPNTCSICSIHPRQSPGHPRKFSLGCLFRTTSSLLQISFLAPSCYHQTPSLQ